MYLAEFEKTVGRVCLAPYRYPVESGYDVRRIQMDRFPYTLLYREVSGIIQILAVAHHRRRPQYWLTRL